MVGAQVEVYEGMTIGIHKRENDLNVNAVKGKALNNVRTAGGGYQHGQVAQRWRGASSSLR